MASKLGLQFARARSTRKFWNKPSTLHQRMPRVQSAPTRSVLVVSPARADCAEQFTTIMIGELIDAIQTTAYRPDAQSSRIPCAILCILSQQKIQMLCNVSGKRKYVRTQTTVLLRFWLIPYCRLTSRVVSAHWCLHTMEADAALHSRGFHIILAMYETPKCPAVYKK